MKECRSKAASGSPEAARHYSCGVAKEGVPSLTGREDHLAILAGYCKQRGFQSGVPQLSSTEARTPVPRMLYGFVLKSLSQCASKLAVIAGRDAGSCAMVCFRLPAKLFNAIELETVRSAFREIEDALDEQNVRGDPVSEPAS
jgi:hypothetical protein